MARSPVLIKTGDFALDRVFYVATETFPFVVRAGIVTAQPGEGWFLLDLSYTIVFGEESADGFAWVSADTNGLTAAQAEYTLTREAGALRVHESTVTLQDGQEERRLDGLSATLDYVNYAREEGIVEGRNSFTIRVEHTDGVVIERVEFHEDSGVSKTAVSPHPFQLSATAQPGEIRIGDEFEVLVRAENTSSELGDAVMQAAPNPGFARVVGPATVELGRLSEAIEHTYRFVALSSGPGQVAILGTSSKNEPTALVDLVVLSAPSRNTGTLALIAVVGAAPVALGLAVMFIRARRRA